MKKYLFWIVLLYSCNTHTTNTLMSYIASCVKTTLCKLHFCECCPNRRHVHYSTHTPAQNTFDELTPSQPAIALFTKESPEEYRQFFSEFKETCPFIKNQNHAINTTILSFPRKKNKYNTLEFSEK